MKNLFNTKTWGNKRDWPVTPREHIFLCEAFDQVGRAMHSDWNGEEFRALPEIRENYNVFSVREMMGLDPLPFPQAQEQFADCIAINRSRADKLDSVCDWIVQGAANGDFSTYLRHVDGGPPLEVERDIWNGKSHISNMFCDAIVKYAPEVAYANHNPRPCYIFFDRSTFEAAVSVLLNAPLQVSMQDMEALPGPLRIAVRLALDNPGIAAMTEKERFKLATPRWSAAYAGPISKKYVGAIAAVLGEPNLKRIEQGKAQAKR